eukprot:14952281-Ditylum_brightwellii.AAC.1
MGAVVYHKDTIDTEVGQGLLQSECTGAKNLFREARWEREWDIGVGCSLTDICGTKNIWESHDSGDAASMVWGSLIGLG